MSETVTVPAASSEPRAGNLARLGGLPIKVLMVVVAALLLLIPLDFIGGLTREREARRDEAIAGIHRGWAGAQSLVAPLLLVPVVDPGVASLDERRWIAIPAARATLDVALDAQTRARGLFETVVYRAVVTGAATFAPPASDAAPFAGRRVLWDEAVIAAPIAELRGLVADAGVTVAGRRVGFVAREAIPIPGLGTVRALVAPVGEAVASGRGLGIGFDFSVRGSAELSAVALAREAQLRVRSPWPHPSFQGALLPDERRIGGDGFDAVWRPALPHLPAALAPGDAAAGPIVEEARLIVALADPVPTYRMVERARKFDALLIAFTFLVFLLFETLWGARLSVMHYAMVGGALCLFYLLLLSFAELIGFAPAYVAASALVIAQAGLYGLALLRSAGRALAFGALLAAAYAYFFALLMLESHALVAGALALFAGLSGLMYVTRRVEWGRSPAPA